MYSAVLLGFGAHLVSYFSFFRLGLYAAELIVLLIKIPAEEKFLEKFFSGYKSYKSRTKRLIPYIY
jgi:protein-S-isoprenylcysteine O-methyltransferase Ste14